MNFHGLSTNFHRQAMMTYHRTTRTRSKRPGKSESDHRSSYSTSNAHYSTSIKLTFTRGWAKGRRTAFFEDHMPDYVSARARGPQQARDYIINVANEYCAEFTWWLEPPKEPTPEDLAKNDSDLDPSELALKDAKLKRLRTVCLSRRRPLD